MSAPDPRLTLARPDLAALELECVAPAQRYAAPARMRLAAPMAAVHRAAEAGSERMDELLHGEAFDVLETRGGFAWGRARRDGYVGFVAADTLAPSGPAPTHWVRARSAFAFETPSIKSPAVGPYSLNSLVAVEAEEGDFARSSDGAWFWRGHLSPIGVFERDPAAVAERLLGAPYLWGGRSSLGLDCSGLIQAALQACGRACPRDTDLQAALGRAIARAELGRGDLVCWKGHIGMMLDGARMIHANAHHMAVAVEPVDGAIERIGAGPTGAPTGFRRL